MVSVGNEYALALYDLGFCVLPVAIGQKLPTMKWRDYQDPANRPSRTKTAGWFKGEPRNYFVLTGASSGMVVLDCDNQAAVNWWHDRIGAEMDATACVQTSKGWHYWFRLPEDGPALRGYASHVEGGPSWDVKADGGGVVAPPSIHESGWQYRWERGPEQIQQAPEALWEVSGESWTDDEHKVRSTFADGLRNPPVGEGSGRNVWLTNKVGHLAHGIPYEDALLEVARWLNRGLDAPLPDDELPKMVASVLANERAQKAGASTGAEAALENGWLIAGKHSIIVQTVDGKGEEARIDAQQFLAAGIQATGVSAQDGQATYDVEIAIAGEPVQNALLDSAVLADDRALNKWLAGYRLGIHLPVNAYPRLAAHERLRRLLEWQKPPAFSIADSLGWDGAGFLCYEGRITADGLQPFEGTKPRPPVRQKGQATIPRFKYGFRPRAEAIAVLREVMTWHDEVFCAVFGAWWAACLLKPQIGTVASQFPFMALQASSGSGKSKGFLPAMIKLNGATGQAVATAAGFRDEVALHRSGIVWADDKDDPTDLHEILRAATVEGTMIKKGEDNTSQVIIKLVAPIVIGGESLALDGQKALLDRAVLLDMPSVEQRMSLRNPERKQWEDILQFQSETDFNEYAGTLVQEVLRRADRVPELRGLVPMAGGRFGDKIAILRFGAYVLADILEDLSIVQRVDDWADSVVDTAGQNSLTLKLLPILLSRTNEPNEPSLADGRFPATPAFVQDGIVWFSPSLCSQYWEVISPRSIRERTETPAALTQQARKVSDESQTRRVRLSGTRDKRATYWPLSREMSQEVLSRSAGDAAIEPDQQPQQTLDWIANLPPSMYEEAQKGGWAN